MMIEEDSIQKKMDGLPWEKTAFWGGILIASLVGGFSLFLVLEEAQLRNKVARLSEESEYMEAVSTKITDLGKPGNDILEFYDIGRETWRIENYKKQYAVVRDVLEREMGKKKQFKPLLIELDQTIFKMREEIGHVFSSVGMRKVGEDSEQSDAEIRSYEVAASSAMARMDRQKDKALEVMDEMKAILRIEELEMLKGLRKSFYGLCLLVFVSFGAFLVGLVLLKRLGRVHQKTVALKQYVSNVVASLPVGILVLSGNLRVLSANYAFRTMFLEPDVMLVGRALEEVLNLIKLNDQDQAVLSEGKIDQEIVAHFFRGDAPENDGGKDQYFHFSIVPVYAENFEYQDQGRLLLIVRDVSELKRSELQTQRILTNAQDGVVGFDLEGEITWMNPAAEWMFGDKTERRIGRPFSELISETYQDRFLENIKRFTQPVGSKDPNKLRRIEGLRANGSTFPMEMVLSGFQQEDRWIFTAFMRDKTEEAMAEAAINGAYEELKEKQQQLVQSEKMASIGQLAAGVAHEINNPVGFVKSNLGRMREYSAGLCTLIREQEKLLDAVDQGDAEALGGEAKAIREMSEAMQSDFIIEDLPVLVEESLEGIERVRDIVKNLKEFSHVDGAEVRLFKLNEGLESTLKIAWNELKYHVDVQKEYGDIPEVLCHPQQINQVFMNLLINASHAIKEGAKDSGGSTDKGFNGKKGRIKIRTFLEERCVVTEISDSGVGMSESTMKKIFDPFYTTKPVGKGTGLGLSISYGIIKKHKGQIEVRSKVGKGTTFRVMLPFSNPDEEKTESHLMSNQVEKQKAA
ncbi:MAG: ATP-binding protein [Nitrospiria bacterium]